MENQNELYPQRYVTVDIRYVIPTSMEKIEEAKPLRDFLLKNPDWPRNYIQDVTIISVEKHEN
jgi:hypothetical protein